MGQHGCEPPKQLEHDPLDRDRSLRRAYELHAEGELSAAIEVLYGLLGQDTRDMEVAAKLATMLAEDEQYERAERLFRHAFKLGAGAQAHVRLNHAIFVTARGRIGEGMKLLRTECERLRCMIAGESTESLVLSPEDASDLLGLGVVSLARAHAQLGEHAEALELTLPFLVCPEHWQQAHDLVTESAGAQGEEERVLFPRLIHTRQASPLMVWQYADLLTLEQSVLAGAKMLCDARAFLPDALLLEVHTRYERAQDLLGRIAWELEHGCCEPEAAICLEHLRQLFGGGAASASRDTDRAPGGSGGDRSTAEPGQMALQFGVAGLPLFQRPPTGQ